ncbi:uncharacterized protein LOC120423580 isoform X2 [Culex pipiens pallens]|uniref:uncharacterized protein LOC120423580 isoform X2 n=1 Tax=Culex pipiens pallens TaxID=42434 RepID=UPI001953F25C|nr:uncharacterized protein LOC120423580 isoform X2 [Culex pipiens pallens]
MTAIKQGSNSVHYTGTETISRRTFIGPRYEVPLFLCKRLSVPVERSDTVEQEVLRNGRRELLQEMKHYGLLPNWKAGIAVNLCPDWKTSGKRPTNLSLPRPCCQKSLRNGHKEWTLPPNRYRLGGNISDSASKSTGDRFPTVVPGVSGGTPGLQPGEELYYEQIPREMDKLAQPRRYFVGKIRPGDKATERPCSRLALSTATLCWRNPADPGPDRYFKGIFDIALPKLVATTTADPPTTVRHSYCAEPFRRPPPGRYDLTVCRGLVPLNVAPPRQRRLRRRLEMTLNASWKPFRQVATLRMHTVDIPKRRRKRGRNMKVAFGSSTARFKDQDFFPIGALQSTIPSQHQHRRPRRKSAQSASTEGPNPNQNHRSSTNFTADEEEPTTAVQLATLDRTRTKLFIVPRRYQTVAALARLLQVPPSTQVRGETKMRTSRVKIEPADVDVEGNGPTMEAEVFDDDSKAAVVGDKAIKIEVCDEKSNSSD